MSSERFEEQGSKEYHPWPQKRPSALRKTKWAKSAAYSRIKGAMKNRSKAARDFGRKWFRSYAECIHGSLCRLKSDPEKADFKKTPSKL